MFDGIARRYDLLNRLTSFGLDSGWRRALVRALDLGPGDELIDLATGTGDVALGAARAYARARVLGVDPSRAMLALARRKVAAAGLGDRIALCEGDACRLPFADGRFAACTIAFGIRNIADRSLALREMARVTRPGGPVVVLELSEPRGGAIASLARLHVRHVVPQLGAWLASSAEYRYLTRSIAAFPRPAEFAAEMAQAGLTVRSITALGFGSAQLFIAGK